LNGAHYRGKSIKYIWLLMQFVTLLLDEQTFSTTYYGMCRPLRHKHVNTRLLSYMIYKTIYTTSFYRTI